MSRSPLVAIFADESCLGNGREGENPGGAGTLLEVRRRSGEIVRRDLWVSEPATTNNRMALRSVIEAFTALSHKATRYRVVFISDSRYLIDGMTQWVHDWARRGWKRKTGAIENLELWREAVRVAAGHDVQWKWVRGHAGHTQNEYANELATRAASTLTSSGGLRESSFDTWLSSQAGDSASWRLEPFPDDASFRAAPRLPAHSAVSP